MHNSPPVPPQDHGGNYRIGWQATGVLCLVVGWLFAIAINLAAHVTAPSGGHRLFGIFVGPSMGPYGWTVLGIGLAVGFFGIVLLHLARTSPPGRFILPGYPY